MELLYGETRKSCTPLVYDIERCVEGIEWEEAVEWNHFFNAPLIRVFDMCGRIMAWGNGQFVFCLVGDVGCKKKQTKGCGNKTTIVL